MYVAKAAELGFKNKLPSFTAAQSRRSQQSSIGLTAGGPGLVRPDEFTTAKMHRALVDLITADDQVRIICLSSLLSTDADYFLKSIAVLDCPEFRSLLLLLRSDLKDSDIPHRTKGRSLIIEAWKDHFATLRVQLAVCAM